jgi:putative transposase
VLAATICGMLTVSTILGLLQASLRTHQRLVAENLALRHQLAVLKRSVKRPRIDDSDRVFWILMRRTFKQWKDCLHFVQPETVLCWHRKGFKYYWKRKSKPKTQGRPAIGWKLVHLIRRMSQENATWGAPKIQAEIAVLGHEVAETTVAKYMVRHRNPESGQRWSTFLRNHMGTTIACDFFTVPSVTFKNLFVFVVLHHGSRRIVPMTRSANPLHHGLALGVITSFRLSAVTLRRNTSP